MKRLFLFFVVIVSIGVSCTDRDDDIDMVNIRIRNNSSITFNEVRVVDKDTVYENIAPDEISEYIEYQRAYREMGLTIIADSITYNFTPSEVQTDSLPIGLYTYELGINEENEIDFKFTIDY